MTNEIKPCKYLLPCGRCDARNDFCTQYSCIDTFDPSIVEDITLLSKEEFEAYKENIKPIKQFWWLRTPGSNQVKVYYVDVDIARDDFGLICSLFDKYVRPALILKPNNGYMFGDTFKVKGHKWTMIAHNIALCDDNIGSSCFRWNFKEEDANDYEASDIKKYIHSWWNKEEENGTLS